MCHHSDMCNPYNPCLTVFRLGIEHKAWRELMLAVLGIILLWSDNHNLQLVMKGLVKTQTCVSSLSILYILP